MPQLYTLWDNYYHATHENTINKLNLHYLAKLSFNFKTFVVSLHYYTTCQTVQRRINIKNSNCQKKFKHRENCNQL